MGTLPYYIVNAFADGPFTGNPAGVCVLREPLPEGLMQRIAAQNNLPETAFVLPAGEGYAIRWFTPRYEIDLCGHATLASAFVVSAFLTPGARQVRFTSASGPLTADCADGVITLDFPSRPAPPVAAPAALAGALGAVPLETYLGRDLVAVLPDEESVRGLRPDFAALARLPVGDGVIATAPGRDCDFVSRCFYPKSGVDEDPVTGSAHCNLIPYWAARLGKTALLARQLSARGGALSCALAGKRVRIGGRAALYLTGALTVSES